MLQVKDQSHEVVICRNEGDWSPRKEEAWKGLRGSSKNMNASGTSHNRLEGAGERTESPKQGGILADTPLQVVPSLKCLQLTLRATPSTSCHIPTNTAQMHCQALHEWTRINQLVRCLAYCKFSVHVNDYCPHNTWGKRVQASPCENALLRTNLHSI